MDVLVRDRSVTVNPVTDSLNVTVKSTGSALVTGDEETAALNGVLESG